MRRVGWGPGKGRRIGLVLNCPGRAEAGWGEELLPLARSLSLPSLQLGTVERQAGISRTWVCTEPGGDRRSGAAAPRPGQSPRGGSGRGRGRRLRGGAAGCASCGLRGRLAGGPACVSAVSPGVFH